MDHPVLAPLPPKVELETRPVLKRLVPAHRYLAELKGMAATIPNEHILIIYTHRDYVYRKSRFLDMSCH